MERSDAHFMRSPPKTIKYIRSKSKMYLMNAKLFNPFNYHLSVNWHLSFSTFPMKDLEEIFRKLLIIDGRKKVNSFLAANSCKLEKHRLLL